MEGYGTTFIEQTFGIPLSALHYWDATRLLKPSVRPAGGRGTKRLYSFRDLVQLLIVVRMRRMGVPLQRIRACLAYLKNHVPDLDAPLAQSSLVTDGETLFLLTQDRDAVSNALREQFVWSVPLGALLRSAKEGVAAVTTPHTEKLLMAGRKFTVTLEQDPEDGWWIGFVKELPGCGTQGKTKAELREMLADAIETYLSVDEEQGHAAKARRSASWSRAMPR